METVRLTKTNTAEIATRAADVLATGGIVLYPTDTLYGLGADAFSNEAVAKIYAIKGRDEGKPIHALVADEHMAGMYGELNDFAHDLLRELPQGKITLVVKKSAHGRSALGGKKIPFNTGIVRNVNTFGFRIPDNRLCQAMLKAFGKPITATSANSAGLQTLRTVQAIREQLGSRAEAIDLIIDAGELPEAKASSVVDLSHPEPVIVREAALPAADIWDILRAED